MPWEGREMTHVKCYDIGTGHVEEITVIDWTDPIIEEAVVEAFISHLVSQDRSTDHVYYVTQEG
jgi:hypothetical protein